ncbi:MAG: PA14 domain-containing protein [Planctomycetota bacterium]
MKRSSSVALLAILAAALPPSLAQDRAAPAADKPHTMRVKNLRTLAIIYRGAPAAKDRMDDHALLQAKNGLELGRAFYFRNSRARLNTELNWLVIDAPAPKNDGPTMDYIEKDVLARGIKKGEHDGVIATGVGFTGNWGGFELLGGAGGCFGIGGFEGVGYPAFDPGTGYGWAWIYAHEFQHALDGVIVEGSGLKMLSDHPYADHREPHFKGCYLGGEHWDWVALTMREFDEYLEIKGVTNSFFECIDADRDGLPDADPRLPMDEQRFGSDPTKADTDGDGLDDLAEFIADRFGGSDQRKTDTDGDGLSDADDPYPLIAIRPTLPYRSAAVPAAGEQAPLLSSVFARNDAGGPCPVSATWDEDGLYFEFTGPRRFTVALKLDGSAANGFWEGGDTYLIRIADGKVTLDGLGLSGDVPGATAAGKLDGDTYRLTATIPARLGQGVSKEINYGGKREPQDVAGGLTLVPGRSIALNVIYEFDNETEAVLTPNHAMYATRLVKPENLPARPVLRGPETTAAGTPAVEVLGIGQTSKVSVFVVAPGAERVAGSRIGPGPVQLVQLKEEGEFTLQARSGEAKTNTLRMRVDRSAEPPRLNWDAKPAKKNTPGAELGVVTAETEPNASFELWWGVDGVPVAPLAGARADEKGHARVPLGDPQLSGWVVTGYDGAQFERKVFVDSWPKIQGDFENRPPDPRLPSEFYSLKLASYLFIEPGQAGVHTFELSSDDGARLYIDDELVINHWGHHGLSPRAATLHLGPGPHPIRIDYYQEDGWAGLKLRHAPPGGELTFAMPVRRTPVPFADLDLFGVQTDPLGNRSSFSRPLRQR